MSSKFYTSIIEEEKKAFNIKDDALKKAAKDVSKVYSPKCLRTGLTFLDYNHPPNRCAYLFKFAAGHTGLTAKYFQQLTKNKEILNNLNAKKHIRICSLGGGPGTDVVGIFKAMAIIPSLHKKVVQVTILDICGGWRNSFKHVISRLKHGKVAGVPASFIDANEFKADLIAVDLMKPLPENIKKVISNADVISMVKFVSAVVEMPGSIDALKAIASLPKPGATVFFIDNLRGKVFQPLQNISTECGLDTVLGPLHANYISCQKRKKPKITAYGCPPLIGTKISVIGWTKTSETVLKTNSTYNSTPVTNSNDDDAWDTDSDSMDSGRQVQTKLFVTQLPKRKKIHTKNAQIESSKPHTKNAQIEPSKPQSKNYLQTDLSRQLLTKIDQTSSCVPHQTQNSVKIQQNGNIRTNLTHSNIRLDKWTQTDANDMGVSETELAELQDLIVATSELIRVMRQLNLSGNKRKCCHGCSH